MRHAIVDDKPLPRRSREGVPLGEYRALEALAALPFGLGLAGAMELLRHHVVEEPIDLGGVPRNAIVYLYHVESFLVTVTPGVWKSFGDDLTYLGFHGFASYFGGVWPYLHRFRCFRYDKRRPERPLEQTIAYLRAHPERRFALRTDSGGPYGKVRGSLVDMALRTGRPLVGMRQLVDRATTLRRHVFPLPGALVRTRFTRPIFAAELQALSREEARLVLQREIDALG